MTKLEMIIDTVDLLPKLDKKLIELLESLSPEDWHRQSVAKLWKVKDVVAHLLDINIRVLSTLRDDHSGENPTINSYQDLVDYLNELNADWVKAMKRVSPTFLIELHKITGPLFCEYYKSLNPQDEARFSVAWAGEQVSKNWKHIAREYTEKWLHQQQIREAVNKPGLMTKEFFYPFIDTFMLGLPHTFRDIIASEGTAIQVTITTDIGCSWFLIRKNESWVLEKIAPAKVDSTVQISPDIAWKLFSKSIRPEAVGNDIIITGNQNLGNAVLSMVSVMA
ncbi:MAG: maleylpyruvate isomerase N-terminal domain-containing protein [Flammeovirgaceae bacterium]|jgi:hypothetical protein|nr:maleylpyruvate isomerase N-terminal domain-containing protein [Flammeovirgaceae bacterium]